MTHPTQRRFPLRSSRGSPPRPLRRAFWGRIELEQLEIRITPSNVVPIDSDSPVSVPLGGVKAGDSAPLKVTFTTTDNFDPDDRTEGEPLVIEGPGYSNTIFTYGTQTIQVPVTEDGEELSAYIKGADGDESATIETAGTVSVEEVSTDDSKSLTVRYSVQGNDDDDSFPIDVYRSSESQPDEGDQVKVAEVTVDGDDADDGEHSIVIGPADSGGQFTFMQAQALRPDPGHDFVIATADEDGSLDEDDADDPPSASFRIFLLGAVSHGYIFSPGAAFFPNTFTPPIQTFVDTFADDLVADDDYDAAFGFHWEDTVDLPQPLQAVNAGAALAQQVDAQAADLDPGPDDVVDVSLIGWSRGGVVVNAAMADLANSGVAQVRAGFMMETLVDPHPANNQISGFSSHQPNLLALATAVLPSPFDAPAIVEGLRDGATALAVHQYQSFQSGAQDLAGVGFVVPGDVQAVADYYQNTQASDFGFFNSESLLNLWGLTPSQISSSIPIQDHNETAPGIGHSEIMMDVYHGVILAGDTLAGLGLEPFDDDPLVVTSQPPGTIAAGTPFGLVVKAENSNGTVNTSFNGPVTLAIGTPGSAATLGGTVTATASNGVATFSGLTVNQAGTIVLTATAAGLPPVATNTIVVTPAPELVVSIPTGFVNVDQDVFAGQTFALTVHIEDPNGNVQNYSGPVTIALGNDPGGASLSGTLMTNAFFGTATFSNLKIGSPGVGFTLVATAPGAVSGTSAPFKVSRDQLVMTTPPGVVAAGKGFGLVVKAEDAQGVVDTSFNGDVSVALSNFTGGADNALNGPLTVQAVNGVATFGGLSVPQVGTNGNYEIEATSPGLTDAFGLFTVVAGPPAQVAITQEPADVTAGKGFTAVVSVEDAEGNVATSYNGTVTIVLGTNPGGTLGGTLSAQAQQGVATFSGLSIAGASGAYHIQATATGLTPVASGVVNVTPPGAATHLVVSTPPPFSVVSGIGFGLTVKAEDDLGTVDTGDNGPVTLSVVGGSASAGLGGTVTVHFVNGVAAFSSLTLGRAGDDTLSLASAGLGGTTASIDVTPGAATKLVVIGPSGHFAAGGPFGLEVDAEDAFGNVVTGFGGSVTVSLQQGGSPAALGGVLTEPASGGAALFDLAINAPGSGYVIQASSGTLPVASSSPFNVSLDRLVVTTQPAATVTTGGPLGLVVEAVDALGNLDTSFHGTVSIGVNSSSTPATLGGLFTTTAAGGIATFSGLTLNQGGIFSLVASGPGLAPATTNAFTVTSVPAGLVVATPLPVAVTTGASFGLVVRAEDAAGHIDSTFDGPVTVALASNPGGGTLGGMLTVDAVHGVATFPGLSIAGPGSGYTLHFAGVGLSLTTGAFDVRAAGVATRLVVATQPPTGAVAGAGFGLVLSAEDDFGTADPTFTGPVTAVLASNPGGGSLGGTRTVGGVGGVATFAGLSIYPAGSYTLSASAGGLDPATTGVVHVTPAKATRLEVLGPNGDVLTGAPFRLTVEAVDANGQVDPTFAGIVALSIPGPSAGSLGGTLTAAAIGGVATFGNVSITQAGGGLTIRATSTGLIAGVSPSFDALNDQLVVTAQPPATLTAGTGFGLTVAIENASGQVDTSFNGLVTASTFSFGGPAATLGGHSAVNAVHGVAKFSGLTLDRAGDDVLALAGNGAVGATTRTVVVTGRSASQLVATGLPPAVTVGAPFVLVVSAEDSSGDVDPTFTGPVTVSLAAKAGGSLGGTLTVNAVGGVATFSGLSIGGVGSGDTLHVSGGGLAVTTGPLDVRAAGVATRLVVAAQPPTGAVAGAGFGLVVDAEDDFGALDPGFAGPVTAALASNPGGPLGGLATVNAVGGAATFVGLSIAQAADGYTLSLSHAGLASSTTDAFSVVAATASKLSVVGPGSNVLPGGPFSVDVEAVDAFGNVASSYTGPVTLALVGGAAGATLGGTTTVGAVGGVAIFDGLSIGAVGSGYTLRASAVGPGAAASSPFAVSKDQLMVAVQPPGQVATGSGFGLGVLAEDANGNVDTTFNGPVTLSLLNLGAGNPTLGGTLTTQAIRGVATFSGLSTSQASTFALAATSGGVGMGLSNPVAAVAGATGAGVATIGVTPGVAAPVFGQSLTFVATAKATASGQPTPTGTVQFEADGNPFGPAVALINGAATSPSLATLGAGTHAITAVYSGDATFNSATSAALSEAVARAPLEVIANSPSRSLGRANPPLFVAYSGFVLGQGPASLSGTLTISTTATAASPAGRYAVTAGGLTSSNYAITFVPGILTVSKEVTTVAIVSSALHPTYGQSLIFGAAVAPAPGFGTPTGTIQFFVDGAAFGSPVPMAKGAALSPDLATLGVGAHLVAAIYSGDATYSVMGSPILTESVARAPLTITADSTSRVLGQPNLPLTANYSGFVNGDTPASLTSPVTLATLANPSSAVGSYPILAGGAASNNYAITFRTGLLNVVPPPSGATPQALEWTAEVTTLYEEILGRAPDASGFAFWVRALGRGTRLSTVALNFWNSPEHLGLVATNQAPRIAWATALKDAQTAGQIAFTLSSAVPTGPQSLIRT